MGQRLFAFCFFCLTSANLLSVDLPPGFKDEAPYWKLAQTGGIVWQADAELRLPHGDHLEMSGRRVSVILNYQVDKKHELTLSRKIFYPMLRILLGAQDPDWLRYRAYLVRDFASESQPQILIAGKPAALSKVSSITINGAFFIAQPLSSGVELERTLYPSMSQELVVERWTFVNKSSQEVRLAVMPRQSSENIVGHYGEYRIVTSAEALPEQLLRPGERVSTHLFFAAGMKEKNIVSDGSKEWADRLRYLQQVQNELRLETPSPMLNQAFSFAKIRTAESLFETRMGLVHSPGGGNYYGGIWNNDQIEYAAPFFPLLGFPPAITATTNALRKFKQDMKPDYSRIWPSYEMEGDLTCCSQDRGDAAMYAYGAGNFLLEVGSEELAREFWPAIVWCLEYCERKKNADGVITSESDEMEGRIPAGDANLTTSALTYGAEIAASRLARSLGLASEAVLYEKRAAELRQAIDRYFGATVEGLRTYRYFKGHEGLRHWICLPLVMGMEERKEGTIEALLHHLWTPVGLRVQTGVDVWWDRGTLYALNGIMKAGDVERGLSYLEAYTRQRLLGAHVPYAIEAWPENNQAHLAAESALYGRIFTEGLFGITPLGLHEFQIKPAMPQDWPKMALRAVHLGGHTVDVEVARQSGGLQIKLSEAGQTIKEQTTAPGESVKCALK